MKIVCLSGPKTCGKDTAAKALLGLKNNNGNNAFIHKPMAKGVKLICADVFGYSHEQMEDSVLKETPTDKWPELAPRVPMMDIANWFRDRFGGSVWVHRWERHASTWQCNVVTDLRFPEELEFFKRMDALIIYINRDEAEEALASKIAAGDSMATNVSESHYKMLKLGANFIVDNNGSIPQLHGQIQALVRQRWGYWGHW